MKKTYSQTNPIITEIFNDLEKFKEFCVEYGYVYNEAELYNNKSFSYKQYTKHLMGKQAKDMWEADAKPE